MRMIQLKMHVTGDAERAISRLGSKGFMYVTALKILKEQFGQPSTIARSLVNQLTKGDKIQRNDRRAFRELSKDLVNCVATMHQVKYFADVNASDNLRKIVRDKPRPWRFDVLTGCVTHARESRCVAHYGTRKRLAENVSISEISVDF